ncbi:type VI secretion system contractile sheath large subunit, partial [Halomonas sp. AOP7-C1-8]
MSKTAKQTAAAVETEAEVSLLDQVMAQTRMAPADEGYDVAKQGVAAFIAELLNSDTAAPNVNKGLVDSMIVELDRKISHQVDEILHED